MFEFEVGLAHTEHLKLPYMMPHSMQESIIAMLQVE